MKFYVIFSILAVVTLQGGCMMQEKKDPYKQGELVTWKINDELIIKGHLGKRRKHIVGEFDAEFYHPNTQQFMGQFPIDYLPKKFDPISKGEAVTLQQNNTGNPFEFYLMLNGSWVEPTDESIYSPRALDHEDQVKIQVKRVYNLDLEQNTREFFENDLMKDLDKNSEHELYGMKCFILSHGRGKRCFSKSSNPYISGFRLSHLNGYYLIVSYNEFIYGGISITYIAHPNNLSKVNEIDQAIWRMLDTWNVSPNQLN